MLGFPSGNGCFAPSGSGGHHFPPCGGGNYPPSGCGGHLRPAAVVNCIQQRWLSSPVERRRLPAHGRGIYNPLAVLVIPRPAGAVMPPIRQRRLPPCPAVVVVPRPAVVVITHPSVVVTRTQQILSTPYKPINMLPPVLFLTKICEDNTSRELFFPSLFRFFFL